MPSAYVWTEPKEYMRVLRARNSVHKIVDTDSYFRKQKPHITVAPSFKVKDGHTRKLKREINDLELSNVTANISGLGVHESLQKPRVIYYNIELDGGDQLINIRERLDKHCKTEISEPVDPHITILKTKGWWEEVPHEVQHRLGTEIEKTTMLDEVHLEDVKVEIKE